MKKTIANGTKQIGLNRAMGRTVCLTAGKFPLDCDTKIFFPSANNQDGLFLMGESHKKTKTSLGHISAQNKKEGINKLRFFKINFLNVKTFHPHYNLNTCIFKIINFNTALW